jgi:hypothetical protein
MVWPMPPAWPDPRSACDEKGAAVKIAKVNVDESPDLASQFGVRSIPMMVFSKMARRWTLSSVSSLKLRLLRSWTLLL